MKSEYWTRPIHYDGSQLRSLFAYQTMGVVGDSVVAFEGGCDVAIEHMIDGEDRFAGQQIRGDRMMHFIVEKFGLSIWSAVCLQRLLAAIVSEVIHTETGQALRRDGDDLFLGEKKLSISIATVSPVSALIHFAVNVVNSGTPVPTLSLEDLRLDPERFARLVLSRFAEEEKSITWATQKVFPAR